jgi:outer membrane assembly lipoprotein YfiO
MNGMIKNYINLPLLILLAVMVLPLRLMADDASANEEYKNAVEEFKAGKYKSSGDTFMDAELLADSTKLKAACVNEATLSYRKAKLYWKEFNCLEKLLSRYPSYIDYSSAIDREFDIADAFFAGHRDPAFWTFRWIPWLTEPDRTVKVFQQVIKRVPFGKKTPQAMLRLAFIYIEEGKTKKALGVLRQIIQNFPHTESCRYAYLELGSALFQLAQKGDGDGKYNKEATRMLEEYIKKYPDSQEVEWAQKSLLKTRDIAAKRYLGMARFYSRIGNTPPASRYLNTVLTKYPGTTSEQASEELLVKLDQEYRPTGFRPELESRVQTYTMIKIPEEYEPIMIVPENSDGKWLRPIRNINFGTKNSVAKERAEKSRQPKDDEL